MPAPQRGKRRKEESSSISLSLKLSFLVLNLAKKFNKEPEMPLKDTERLKLNQVLSGTQEVVVQLNLVRKFTMWGLSSIFDLIYSCVLSLSLQGQPM